MMLNKKVICCYKVIVTEDNGYETRFHVRMAYFPKFVKRFLINGAVVTIVGFAHEEVFEDELFLYSEKLPF